MRAPGPLALDAVSRLGGRLRGRIGVAVREGERVQVDGWARRHRERREGGVRVYTAHCLSVSCPGLPWPATGGARDGVVQWAVLVGREEGRGGRRRRGTAIRWLLCFCPPATRQQARTGEAGKDGARAVGSLRAAATCQSSGVGCCFAWAAIAMQLLVMESEKDGDESERMKLSGKAAVVHGDWRRTRNGTEMA